MRRQGEVDRAGDTVQVGSSGVGGFQDMVDLEMALSTSSDQ